MCNPPPWAKIKAAVRASLPVENLEENWFLVSSACGHITPNIQPSISQSLSALSSRDLSSFI